VALNFEDHLPKKENNSEFSSAVDGISGIDFYGAVLLQSFAKRRPTSITEEVIHIISDEVFD
jgi:hypothetical protein